MSDVIEIGGRKIGKDFSPFIIAEMSGNHNQSLDCALQIVEAAAKTGVHALKLQTYTADTITLDVKDRDDFYISDKKNLWHGNTLYDLYKKAHTPWEWHKPIFERCKELGLIVFSTPFDETAVDFLETLNVSCYKIASFENVHVPLIKKVASTGKPIIISTGMATISEIDEAVRVARDAGCKDLVLMKCTSNYPADPKESNLMTIPHMQDLFKCQIGLSDHTLGIGVPVASVVLGATVIEKHFALSKEIGIDAAFSLTPNEMKQLVQETTIAWKARGNIHYGPTNDEKRSLKFKRSLYVSKDIKAGEVLTKDCVRVVRPGYGLQPKYYEQLLGRKIRQDVKKGTPLCWDLLIT